MSGPLISFQEVPFHTRFSQTAFVPSLHFPASLLPAALANCLLKASSCDSGRPKELPFQTRPGTTHHLQTLSRTFDDVFVREDVRFLDDAGPSVALPPFSLSHSFEVSEPLPEVDSKALNNSSKTNSFPVAVLPHQDL